MHPVADRGGVGALKDMDGGMRAVQPSEAERIVKVLQSLLPAVLHERGSAGRTLTWSCISEIGVPGSDHV